MSDNHGGCIRAFSATLAGDDTHRNWPAGVGASGMKNIPNTAASRSHLDLGSEIGPGKYRLARFDNYRFSVV